nr:MAG TPA: hypothetical protein [Caudoviricetes sp.]
MKFTTYQAAVEPNTMHPPAVRVSSDVNAYGSGGEEYGKLGAAIGQVNKVLAQRRDDLDAADVMKARNEIMTSLTQQLYGENGLFVTGVGENAKGLMGRTTDAINQTYDDVSKHYNDRVKYALKGNLNENMANFQRIAASKEMAEGNEVRRETFASNLATNAQQAALTWQVNGAPTMYVKNGDTLLQVRAKQEGWSGAQLTEERRKMVTDVAAAAAGAALENEDYDRADEILNQFRPDMDQQTYWKLARVGKQKQQAKEMDTEADEIFNMPGVWDGKNFNAAKAMEYVNARYGKDAVKSAGGAIKDKEGFFAAVAGQESGGNYSAQNGRTGAFGKYQIMPENWPSWAQEAGLSADAPQTPENQEIVAKYKLGQYYDELGPEGALVAWYAGYQNGERWRDGAQDAIGAGGHYSWDAKQGNGDEPSVREYVQEALGRAGGAERTVSAYDPEKRDRLMKLIEAKGGDRQKAYQQQRRQYLDGVMQAAQSAGSYSAALSMLNGQDLSMDERVSIERTIGQYYHVGGGSGGGRAGGGRPGSGYNPSKDIETMKKMNARIDTGTKISSDQFVAYKSAALRLDNSGLLGDEYQELQNNPEVWSQITDDIETGGLDKAMKRLISCGVDPVTACALLAKSDVSTALTNDFEDEDEESHDEYQGTD